MSFSIIEVPKGERIPDGLEVVQKLEEHDEELRNGDQLTVITLLVKRVSLVGVPHPR